MLFALYDTETTGLPAHKDATLGIQPRIIEFGGIITDGDQIIDEFEFVCNPQQVLEEVITKITGFTNADLDDAPTFGEFVPKLKKFFKPVKDTGGASVAHNANFDKQLLTFDLTRAGKTLEDIDFPPIVICTVEESFFRYGKRVKLEDLYNLLVGEYVQTHRALSDVKSLFEVTKALGVFDAYSAITG